MIFALDVADLATLIRNATKKSASLGGTSKRISVLDADCMVIRGEFAPNNVTGVKSAGGMGISQTSVKKLLLSMARISL